MRIDDRIDRRRGGFALPAVLGALVIIGILATAGFYTSRQELRIGVASAHTNLAVNIAQAGVNEVMANWNGYQLGNILPWSDTTLTDTISDGIWTVSIANANDFVYFLTATGEVTRGGDMWSGARRTIGLSAKILFADIDPPAALTTRGKVKVGGTGDIDGTNHTPALWAPYCTTVPPNDTTGVMVDDSTGGNPSTGGAATIGGSPPADEDSTLVDSSFTIFGDMTWNELTLFAQQDGKEITSLGTNITVTEPVLDGSGRCDTDVLTNWGDSLPLTPCGAYFPLIYHAGNVDIQSTGYGQGILLVEGDLRIRGGYTFFGIIITQGTFTTGSGVNRVVGAVMASNAADLGQTFTGTALIEYSRCAVTRAVLNNAALSRARPLEERSWVDLSGAFN
jgi:hypothetical protein